MDGRAASSSRTAAGEIGRIQSVERVRSLPSQAAGPDRGRAVAVVMWLPFIGASRPAGPQPRVGLQRAQPYKRRGMRPATARTLRGAASHIATAETAQAPTASQNAST